MISSTQVLVTHHVELVLPGAYYLVRMLDGRIDTQGTVKELCAAGVLVNITHDENAEAKNNEKEADAEAPRPSRRGRSRLRRLLWGRRSRASCETGSVKWSIYKTYLRAS